MTASSPPTMLTIVRKSGQSRAATTVSAATMMATMTSNHGPELAGAAGFAGADTAVGAPQR